MPTFEYKAKNQAGQEIIDEVEAVDSKEALSVIMSLGLFPLTMKERAVKKKIAVSKLPPPTHELDSVRIPGSSWTDKIFGGASLKQLIVFTRQFATMIDAGLSVARSLKIIVAQLPFGAMRRAVTQMLADVEDGGSLAEAIAKHPHTFDVVYIRMIEAGEAGGFLERTLNRLADAKEKTLQLRRKVIRAMMYPALVCFAAIMILIFIAVVVVPMLASSGVGGFNFLSNFAVGRVFWALICLLAGFYVLRKFADTIPAVRYVKDAIKLHIPIYGKFCYKVAMVRFSRVLGSLVEAGVPILQALKSVRDTTGNEVFAQTVDKIREELKDGSNITASVKAKWVFDPIATNIIEVGEETGDLDKVLFKLADNYQDDLDTHLAYMMTALEVALIIGMCLFVGGLVLMLWGSMGAVISGG